MTGQKYPAARAWLMVLLAVVAASPGRACGPAGPRNEPVAVADESAVIVWDAANQTQHFVRRASFRTGAKDFGFLVPTPARPTLAEADDGAFDRLARVTAPRVVTQPAPPGGGGCGFGCGGGGPRASSLAPTVEVLEEKRVAGYDAAVLQANDTAALGDWLKTRGYDDSPAIRDWVKPYVEAKWTITAFKVAKADPADPTAATSAVRMSFPTDRPFFPYREPVATGPAPNQSRLLRVYFLATGPVQGTYAVARPARTDAPPGRLPVVWANRLPADARPDLVRLLKLPDAAVPADAYLTEFENGHLDRAGAGDVYFTPNPDQSPVERRPHVRYAARPSDGTGTAVGFVLAAGLAVAYLVFRRLARPTPAWKPR